MKRKIRLSFIFTIIFAIISFIIIFSKNLIVIYYSLKFYKTMFGIFGAATLLFLFMTLWFCICSIREQHKQESYIKLKTEREEEKREKEENLKKERSSYLSTSKQLNENKIRETLSSYIDGNWKDYDDLFKTLITQSEKMDEYQKKLSDVLKINGEDGLDDANEVLDKAEQRLLKNIRKVINYLGISDSSEEKDIKLVSDSTNECIKDNEEILKNTQEFLIALANYLNTKGDDDKNELESLNKYKKILSDVVNETKFISLDL